MFKKIIAYTAALSMCLTGFGQFTGCGLISDIVSAETSTEVEGLQYKVLDNGTIEISEYSGEEAEIVIPETIDGKKVTSIGDYAFDRCKGLTSITIPDSVTSIGTQAFGDCKGLTSITIPDSVTSIGGGAFDGTIWLEKEREQNPLVIINNILIDAVLCEGDVTIPDSVTSIGDYAFFGCKGLTSITIPDSVTSIGTQAFGDCKGLTSITIPDSVTSIGNHAFTWCTGLTSVTIPDSVTSIGGGAFDRTIWLEKEREQNPLVIINNILIDAKLCKGDVTIPDSVSSIVGEAFFDCEGLTSITIPDSVTSIGDGAFGRCAGLTSITIPDSVTSIGGGAFAGCLGLTSITIPDSVTSIGSSAFYRCEGLTSITVPDSVTSIGFEAFGYCKNLTIHGYENSYAQTYAKENDIPFEVINSVPDTPDDKDAVTGDIDNNGVISASDLLSLISYILMDEEITNKLAADLNKDGKVNILDVIALKNILLS